MARLLASARRKARATRRVAALSAPMPKHIAVASDAVAERCATFVTASREVAPSRTPALARKSASPGDATASDATAMGDRGHRT